MNWHQEKIDEEIIDESVVGLTVASPQLVEIFGREKVDESTKIH